MNIFKFYGEFETYDKEISMKYLKTRIKSNNDPGFVL